MLGEIISVGGGGLVALQSLSITKKGNRCYNFQLNEFLDFEVSRQLFLHEEPWPKRKKYIVPTSFFT